MSILISASFCVPLLLPHAGNRRADPSDDLAVDGVEQIGDVFRDVGADTLPADLAFPTDRLVLEQLRAECEGTEPPTDADNRR